MKMQRFTPAPESVIAQFRAAVASLAEVELRTMFGYPCAFLNGQMLAGVFADRIMVRLSEQDRREFLALEGAKPFEPVAGRVMREYVEVPKAIRESPAELAGWVKRGHRYVGTLPPKAAKPKGRAPKGDAPSSGKRPPRRPGSPRT